MRLLSFPGMRLHFVPESSEAALCTQMEEKYNLTPSSQDTVPSAFIDPGGMYDMTTEVISFEVDDSQFEIKPEHIYAAAVWWDRYKQYGDHRKVYMNMHCIYLPTETHEKVGAWLNKNLQTGVDARLHIAERLADVPNVIVAVPSVAKEVGEA